MATWVQLEGGDVQQAMPAAMATMYTMWVAADPARATRLDELTAEVVELCRTAVQAGAGWALDRENDDTVPATGSRHMINLVLFNLGMEMGYQFSEEFYSLVTRADIWLRGVQAGTVAVASAEDALPSPSYEPPVPAGRVLDG